MGVVRRNVAVLDDEDTAPAADIDDGLDAEDEDEYTGRSSAVLTGRAGVKATKEKGANFVQEFRFVTGQKHLIRFLEPESFASYRQHWVEKKGKKSYICIGKGCPLCGAGDNPSGKFAYNVWDYDHDEVKALIMGPVLLEQIEAELDASRAEDLTDTYWALSRSGSGRKTKYKVDEVKVRDLEEDFGITPADAAAKTEGADLYEASIFIVPKVAELTKVARVFTEDDVDEEDD